MKLKLVLASLIAILVAPSAAPSSLTLAVEHHLVVDRSSSKQRVLRTAFTDERIAATVKLDVYALPGKPSTRKNLDELQHLSPGNWSDALTWTARDEHGKEHVVAPRLLSTSFRKRGPDAPNPADRDTSVACASYSGSFDLGALPPGDYAIRVTAAGLESQAFPLAVRSGREPEVRDVYLQEKARRTADWIQYKALQLERIKLDPTKAAAMLELAERSLEAGTVEETMRYFDDAAVQMEKNFAAWAARNPADAGAQSRSVQKTVAQIRALQRVLPEYFANRKVWRVSRDANGSYVFADRETRRVVKRAE